MNVYLTTYLLLNGIMSKIQDIMSKAQSFLKPKNLPYKLCIKRKE